MAFGFNEDKTKATVITSDEYAQLCKVQFKSVASEGAVQIENNVVETVQLFNLPGNGTYIISARLLFSGRAGGQRRIFLTTNESASTWQNQCDGTGNDYLSTSIIVKVTSATTIFIRALQNSGQTCNVTPSDIAYVRLY